MQHYLDQSSVFRALSTTTFTGTGCSRTIKRVSVTGTTRYLMAKRNVGLYDLDNYTKSILKRREGDLE